MSLFRGICVGMFLFLTSYLGTIFMQGPFFWLVIVSPSIFRAWIDLTMTLWLKFAGSLMRYVGGVNIRQFGERIKPGERAIFLLNHRTRLDFMYLWDTLSRFGTCNQEKIILKEGLDRIPGAGWAMQAAAFVFLTRKWQSDQNILSNYVRYFYRTGLKPQILIFPEGTDMCPMSKGRSNAYADKNGLPRYEYVLHPRTTGFSYLLQRMQAEGGIDAIYDITVGYPSDFPTSELQLLSGKIPAEVQYQIKRYDIKSFESLGDGAMSQWLTNLWSEKEKQLTDYYAGSKCFSNEIFPDVSVFSEASIAAYWIIYIIVVIYFISTSWIVFLYFIFANLFCVYYTYFEKGFQKFYMNPVLSESKQKD